MDRGVNSEVVIEAGKSEALYWRDVWRYRELFWFLAWRDFLVRYKQTAAGVLWAVLRPALMLGVLVFVFQRVAKVPEDGIPYVLTALTGVLGWNFFAASLQEAGNSLVANANLISKVYFPRLVAPAASILTALADFLVTALLLAGLMAWHRFSPNSNIIFLPVFILLSIAVAAGAGLWVSALMVRYRDVRFIVPFIVQFGLYVSPVGFRSALVPEQWRLLYSLNPMVGVLDGFRWSLLGGTNQIHVAAMSLSVFMTLLILLSGLWYFRKTERSFADVI